MMVDGYELLRRRHRLSDDSHILLGPYLVCHLNLNYTSAKAWRWVHGVTRSWVMSI